MSFHGISEKGRLLASKACRQQLCYSTIISSFINCYHVHMPCGCTCLVLWRPSGSVVLQRRCCLFVRLRLVMNCIRMANVPSVIVNITHLVSRNVFAICHSTSMIRMRVVCFHVWIESSCTGCATNVTDNVAVVSTCFLIVLFGSWCLWAAMRDEAVLVRFRVVCRWPVLQLCCSWNSYRVACMALVKSVTVIAWAAIGLFHHVFMRWSSNICVIALLLFVFVLMKKQELSLAHIP